MDTANAASTPRKTVLLAAIDESAAAEGVIWAIQQEALGRESSVEIHIAHSIEPLAAPAVALGGSMVTLPESSELRKTASAYLARWAATFPTNVGAVQTHLLVGDPGGELVKLCADLSADMLVVGTHDPGGVERLLFGSVAEWLVRNAPCAVLVMRPKHIKAEDGPVIEPPCPDCLATRAQTNGAQMWCARHSEHHKRAHTYVDNENVGEGFGSGSNSFRSE